MKTISIVIPVYNEAERLAACLEAISFLKPLPLEVIVVDNNSNDGSAAIATQFPFVKLLKETKQGVVHARNRGFNAARGDIIGRIDADTLLPTDWVAQVRRALNDESIAAVSGSAHYHDFALASIADPIDGFCRQFLAKHLKNNNYLWGANMAVHRSAWRSVRSQLCKHKFLHEDFDLAIHLQADNFKVVYDPALNASVSSRRIDCRFADYVSYTLRSPQTYAAHKLRSRMHIYPVLAVCWVTYLPARLIYRAYNPDTQQFSLVQLFAATSARVDPTVNVIS